MRILVCVKHVPDLASARGFGPDRRTIRDAGDSTLNEVDENAIEAALQLGGDHDVVAVTIGPAAAVDAVRRALQMGVDEAVHVCDDDLVGLDAPATGRALAATIRTLATRDPVDLVLMGMTALDGLGSVVPTLVGAELGWAVLTGAAELTVTGDAAPPQAHIARDLDGAAERVQAELPAVVSVSDAINAPRLPKTKDILAARQAPVTALSAAEIGLTDPSSRTQVDRADPAPARPDPQIVHDTGSGGQELADYLIRNDLLGDDR